MPRRGRPPHYRAVRDAIKSGLLERRGGQSRLAEHLGLSRVRISQLIREVAAQEPELFPPERLAALRRSHWFRERLEPADASPQDAISESRPATQVGRRRRRED